MTAGCYSPCMRSRLWISCALSLLACNNSETEYTSISHVTRVVIDPDEFIGEVVCGVSGKLTYQATLYDVTVGLSRAFQLPSSLVVSCSSKVNFERVVPGHRYIATVVGFDRNDVQAQNPGSPLVVDRQGQVVTPRWSTMCWGSDAGRDAYGDGGAGPISDWPELVGGQGQGGQSEDLDALGVTAYSRTEMVMRGCEPWSSEM